MEDVGSPVIKSWGQMCFWQMFTTYSPICCICHTSSGCLKGRDGRENATSVENCWHLNYLPARTGSNFPPQDIKMGCALQEHFSTIWKCCHYIHNWSSLSSDTAREAVIGNIWDFVLQRFLSLTHAFALLKCFFFNLQLAPVCQAPSYIFTVGCAEWKHF